MDVFIYSDESGVFDKKHNDYFVFGGLVFIGKENKDICSRMYANAEKTIRTTNSFPPDKELKATFLDNKSKAKLYRSLNNCYRFGVVIDQNRVHDKIFEEKKSAQRYLDFAYKIAIKRFFESLIARRIIEPDGVNQLHFCVDEHTTATNGCYELREALLNEFKFGTFNFDYSKFYKPIFTGLNGVDVQFCNSAQKRLVRAADITANHFYYLNRRGYTFSTTNLSEHVIYLP